MRDLISLFNIIRQEFKHSDLQTSYSFLYVWMANQFGHIFIGFGGTLLIVALLVPWFHNWLFSPVLGVLLVILIAVAWLSVWYRKERRTDVGGGFAALEKAQRARDKSGIADKPEESDSAFSQDVIRDSVVDGWFYAAGAVLVVVFWAGSLIAVGWENPVTGFLITLLGFFVVFAISIGISRSWLRQKIAFDQASLPFVSRFALLDSVRDSTLRRRIYEFATAQDQARNMLIVGPAKSGRSTLAVALAIEAILRNKERVSYTTLVKLLDQLAPAAGCAPGPTEDPSQSASLTDRRKRRLEDSKLLIIDDIGASFPNGAIVTPTELDRRLRECSPLELICRDRRVIWVIGDEGSEAPQWSGVIAQHFVDNPITVPLSPIPPQERKVGR